MKATRWWKERENVADYNDFNQKSVSGLGNSTRKVALLKAVSGRGPKTAPWVLQTHDDLYLEFRRLKALGVKFSASLLPLEGTGYNGTTLGMRGDTEVKYADVVSGGESMTMMVTITGGAQARIVAPMMIFMNKNRSYPIQGVPDTISGASYHTVQPADSFVISKIKDEWTRRWDIKKLELIQSNEWSNNVRVEGGWSGKLKNSGKTYFLQLAADCVRAVNSMRDNAGLTYARKAMIRCGLSLDVTGFWYVKQLTPELQAIIAKYKNHYEGELVPPPGVAAAGM
ncbi:hypothetical protein DYB36_008092 [Aphanomyces astaci]|uniref:Uncharacterized protein n=1 Tax=Aphanomyces astaci TaxID=112090 RepID=A0A397A9E5_APHAT|nr:hypothetical protein DYB36_008092 [Aphanomyces astaci]